MRGRTLTLWRAFAWEDASGEYSLLNHDAIRAPRGTRNARAAGRCRRVSPPFALLGVGRPAVVMDSALAGSSISWSLIQPDVSRLTRACSYDRAGFGWSDAGPMPRTAGRVADELRVLLERGGVAPPFVLVGHSFGGLVMRIFAAQIPERCLGPRAGRSRASRGLGDAGAKGTDQDRPRHQAVPQRRDRGAVRRGPTRQRPGDVRPVRRRPRSRHRRQSRRTVARGRGRPGAVLEAATRDARGHCGSSGRKRSSSLRSAARSPPSRRAQPRRSRPPPAATATCRSSPSPPPIPATTGCASRRHLPACRPRPPRRRLEERALDSPGPAAGRHRRNPGGALARRREPMAGGSP